MTDRGTCSNCETPIPVADEGYDCESCGAALCESCTDEAFFETSPETRIDPADGKFLCAGCTPRKED